MHDNFESWSFSQIRERVELVQDFDKLCDEIVATYLDTCRNYRIAEQEILVHKMIKVLEPIGGK